MNESAKTGTLSVATRPARSAHPRGLARRRKKLLSVVPVVSQFQTGTGYGISASRPAGAASGAAGEKVTRSHKATKIPSLRGFVASCENTTDYVSEAGEVVASYEYDAFGRTLSATGPMADAFPFRFATKYYDSETGLYYYGRRYYSPELGRWITRDPIGEDGGVNLYAFCGNNGVGRIDATGLSCVTVGTKNQNGKFIKINTYSDIGILPCVTGPSGAFHKQEVEVFFSRLTKKCCEIRLQPYITYLNTLPESHASNAYVGYVKHWIDGKKMLGGNSLGTIRPATLAHEKGHAKAYFEYARLRLEAALSPYCGVKFDTPQSKAKIIKDVKSTVESIVFSTPFLELSAKYANDATLDYYKSLEYESIVPPIALFYRKRNLTFYGGRNEENNLVHLYFLARYLAVFLHSQERDCFASLLRETWGDVSFPTVQPDG